MGYKYTVDSQFCTYYPTNYSAHWLLVIECNTERLSDRKPHKNITFKSDLGQIGYTERCQQLCKCQKQN